MRAAMVTSLILLALGASAGLARSTIAGHTLTVTMLGRDHLCLPEVPEPPLGRPERPSDTFELRAPGHGNYSYGRLLARSVRAVAIDHGCSIAVTFKIPTTVGRFSFFDASSGGIWFGFDSAKLGRASWRLIVTDEGAYR